jgi:hypothetical protein
MRCGIPFYNAKMTLLKGEPGFHEPDMEERLSRGGGGMEETGRKKGVWGTMGMPRWQRTMGC